MDLSIIINTINREQMLFALLKSLEKQDFKGSKEVIVVDDCSSKDPTQELNKYFGYVKLIRNTTHEYLIKSRNKGWKAACGDIVFFIDDDNELFDTTMLSRSVATMIADPNLGVLGCRTYYFDEPTTILMGPNKFNKYLGKVNFLCMNKTDPPEYEGLIDTFDNPNAFFTRLTVLKKTGGFSPEIVQTYSEADYAEKVRGLGLRVVQDSNAKVYHKSPKVDFKKLSIRLLGGSPERFYFLMRNRFILLQKHGTLAQKLVFGLGASHIFNVYYLTTALRNKNYKLVKAGLTGIIHGYIILVTGSIPKPRY